MFTTTDSHLISRSWLFIDHHSTPQEIEDVNDDGAVTISMINFVDLAGSERSKEIALNDQDEKARMKEVFRHTQPKKEYQLRIEMVIGPETLAVCG